MAIAVLAPIMPFQYTSMIRWLHVQLGSYSHSVNSSITLDDMDILIHWQLDWDLNLLYGLFFYQVLGTVAASPTLPKKFIFLWQGKFGTWGAIQRPNKKKKSKIMTTSPTAWNQLRKNVKVKRCWCKRPEFILHRLCLLTFGEHCLQIYDSPGSSKAV